MKLFLTVLRTFQEACITAWFEGYSFSEAGPIIHGLKPATLKLLSAPSLAVCVKPWCAINQHWVCTALQSLCGFKYFYNHRWDMGLGGLCGARIATEQDRDPEILYTIVEVRIEPSEPSVFLVLVFLGASFNSPRANFYPKSHPWGPLRHRARPFFTALQSDPDTDFTLEHTPNMDHKQKNKSTFGLTQVTRKNSPTSLIKLNIAPWIPV